MVEHPQQCGAALQELLAQRVEALLVNACRLTIPTPNNSRHWRRPCRCCFWMSLRRQRSTAVFNAEQGARLGVEHLLSLEASAYCIAERAGSSVSARARLAAWKAALAGWP